MGFTVPLPASLTGVKRGKVQSASERGGGSLRPRLIVAVLGAYHKLLHPLRAAGAVRPDLLRELDHLASLRDESGHAVEDGQGGVTLQRVLEQTELAYAVVALLGKDPVMPTAKPTAVVLKGVS
jgi:hypothetical protein